MDPALRTELLQAQAVRFLCSGNMVRSAFAELYARHRGCPLPVDSAATIYRNPGLLGETRAALRARGLEERAWDAFRPRHLDDLPPDHLRRIVFGMTPDHLTAYRARHGARDALFLTSELTGVARAIADPVHDGTPFEAAFEAVARGVDALVCALHDR